MLAGSPTALLSKQSIFGCSILGCCCDKPVEETGGRQFPTPDRPPQTDNPFVTFTPVPTTSQEIPTPDLAVQTPVSMRRISNRATIHKDTSERRLLRDLRVRGTPDKAQAPHGINVALREAFQQYLLWEEEAFLAILLAADDDECCYDICCD